MTITDGVTLTIGFLDAETIFKVRPSGGSSFHMHSLNGDRRVDGGATRNDALRH